MIIEVTVEEGEPRRYRVVREKDGLTVQRVHRDGDDEAPRAVDFRTPEPRVYSLLIDGHSYDAHVDEDESDEELLTIHLLSQVVRARAADARRHRVARSDQGPDGVARITAPMPGRIAAVLAPVGTAVERGDGILILEAMKMENEIRAPRAGTVTTVEVVDGDGVVGGALLATIE